MRLHSHLRPAGAPAEAVFRSCRLTLLSSGLFSFVINVLMLTGPLFMLQVYDRVLTSRSLPTLVVLTVLVGGLFLFMGLLEWVRSRIMARLGAHIEAELRETTFDAILDHAIRRTPNVGTQPIRDLHALRQFITGPGPFSLFDMPWAPVYIGVNFLLHPLLGLFTAAGAVVLGVLALLNELAMRRPLAEASKAAAATQLLTEEGRHSAEALRAMGMAGAFRARLNQVYASSDQLQLQANNRGSTISALSKAIRMFLQSGVLAAGAALAIHGAITPGMMIAASIIMARALAPIEQAIVHWRGFVGARNAYERLQLVLSSQAMNLASMPLPEPRGRLDVETLVVTAPSQGRILLNGIKFSLRPGDGLGVIGPTGGGKSTLARALVGVWPVSKGAIRLDGATLDQWPAEQLGRAVGYLPQDVELLSGTVGQNIARFAPHPDPAKVVEAARHADAHDMILRLPNGYGTEIGDLGAYLSAGQRQRIGLARALYGRPVLIVLDEPNSNLDSEGEQALTKAIAAARAGGATLIVMAHRPSAIRGMDRLLFLKDGQQLALGPKEEVLSKVLVEPAPRRRTDLAVVKE